MRRFLAIILGAALVMGNVVPVEAGHTLGYLLNLQREAHGLRDLPTHQPFCAVAEWRSRDMLARGYFSHQIPGHPGMVFAVLDGEHIPYALAGEIIGWYEGPPSMAYTYLVRSFMASRSHRDIILGDWDGMCVGVASAHGRIMVTVLFGRGWR